MRNGGVLRPDDDTDARIRAKWAVSCCGRTFIHTVLEEFATYYPFGELMRWLGGAPFIQIGRHAVVNLRAIEHIDYRDGRVYCVGLHDRIGSKITASRRGSLRLATALKAQERSSLVH